MPNVPVDPSHPLVTQPVAGELEDDLPSLQRRRLLAQLDLSFTPLTPESEAAVDAICELLPMADEPNLLKFASIDDRPAILAHLQHLPQTTGILRLLDGHWPG